LRISNTTNRDKTGPAKICQDGVFIVIPPGGKHLQIDEDVENVAIQGFRMVVMSSWWRYRLLMWLAARFASRLT